jgi:hypothetical protein
MSPSLKDRIKFINPIKKVKRLKRLAWQATRGELKNYADLPGDALRGGGFFFGSQAGNLIVFHGKVSAFEVYHDFG